MSTQRTLDLTSTRGVGYNQYIERTTMYLVKNPETGKFVSFVTLSKAYAFAKSVGEEVQVVVHPLAGMPG